MAAKGKKASVKPKKVGGRVLSSNVSKSKPKSKVVAAKKTTASVKRPVKKATSKAVRVSQKNQKRAKPASKSLTRGAKSKPKGLASRKTVTTPATRTSTASRGAKKTAVKSKAATQLKVPVSKAKTRVSTQPARVLSATPILGKKTKMSTPVKSRPKGTSSNLGTMGVPPYEEKRGEAYMNDEQLLHFRKILHLWKQELMEEVDRTVHHMQDEASNFPDPNDRATQEEEFSLELRTRDRERKLIRKIEEALQKIESQDYGYCDSCGIEIGIRRLEARPTANLCIDCKTLDEIKERQVGID